MIIEKARDLNLLNTFRVPATASYYAKITTKSELIEALTFADRNNLPIKTIGDGSNTLFVDDYPGLIIHIANKGIVWQHEKGANKQQVIVSSGEKWHSLVVSSLAKGLYGLENLALIPGTVGAAPIQNIGAYGAEIKDHVVELEVFDREQQQWLTLSREDCEFDYRDSLFRRSDSNPYIIFKVTFELAESWTPNLRHKDLLNKFSGKDVTANDVFSEVCKIRRRKLPDLNSLPNAGSFFKNPLVSFEKIEKLRAKFPGINGFPTHRAGFQKISAAWLLEELGWKGKVQGGAGVYKNHSLVIVNNGNATGKDIRLLARNMGDSVLERYGIDLELEVGLVSLRPNN